MLNKRRRAADTVGANFLRAESAVDEAARHAATCLVTMLEQRAAANLPVATGLDVLDKITALSADLIRVRQGFVEAHGVLVGIRNDIGLGAFYGDESACPNGSHASTETGGARLAAVA